MADDRRVSGTINVREEDQVAAVAYQMAESLWYEKHKRSANMTDANFFLLVRMCAYVLGGPIGSSDKSIRELIASFNAG